MRRTNFIEAICELIIPPEPNHQLAHFSQEPDGFPVRFVVFSIERGIDLSLVNRQRIFRMLFLPFRSEIQP
jgi:hypothetical protein